MNRIFIFVIISFFFTSCSLNKDSKIWKNKDKEFNLNKNQKKISITSKKELRELNPFLELDFSKIQYKNNPDKNLNNYGSLKYSGSLKKKTKYNFSKLEYFNHFYFEPMFLNDGLIIFDKKGNILRFDENKKIIWKNNFYSKAEKKLSPLMTFALNDKNLLVADNISKLFSIDIITGNLIWSKKVITHLILKSKFIKISFLLLIIKTN